MPVPEVEILPAVDKSPISLMYSVWSPADLTERAVVVPAVPVSKIIAGALFKFVIVKEVGALFKAESKVKAMLLVFVVIVLPAL